MVVMCIFDGRMDIDDGIDERQLGVGKHFGCLKIALLAFKHRLER